MVASADPERHNTIATRYIAEAMRYRNHQNLFPWCVRKRRMYALR
jgi:hypothetical protein